MTDVPALIDEATLAALPAAPGVYIMKDAADTVLYIGKAINLRSRVRSYFRETGDGRQSIPVLRSRVTRIETVVTDNEKEALLLENTLIKKHKPRYNIRLRDDKTYISLRFDTTHRWPRLHRVRRRKRGDRALYLGPFASSKAVNETIRFLQRLFPLRSCSDHELANRTRPCILHQIDRCSAPCVERVTSDEYREYVDQTLLFFKGRRDEVIRLLRDKMQQYSDDLMFEKAALVRDRIAALEETVEEEKVHSHRRFDRDVVALARGGSRIVFCVLHYRAGRLEDTRTLSVRDTNLDDAEVVEQFLSQFYDTTRTVPLDVLVPLEPANAEFVQAMLRAQREGAVHLRVPQRGEKKRLLDMATQNARLALERFLAGEQTQEEAAANLGERLHLAAPPQLLHCFDISNFQGSFSVGAMVCFREGEPDKSQYRRFRIRDVTGQDDFAMMREVLQRQYARAARENLELPDLVVIDGGIGQLNRAVEVFRELGLLGRVPVVGLAKARTKNLKGTRVQTEERVFLPGRKNPVTFQRSDPALHLLERLRDETHRFVITYHRLLRTRGSLRSGLEDIPGVGNRRAAALLRHFGSLARIRAADVDALAAAPGMTRKTAESAFAFLHANTVPPPLAEDVDEEALILDEETDEDFGEDDA